MSIHLQANKIQQLTDAMPEKSICLIASGNAPLRNGDVHYHPHRVDSNFFYLTDIDIAQAYLLIYKHSTSHTNNYLLYNQPTEKQKQWEKYNEITAQQLKNAHIQHTENAHKLPAMLEKILPHAHHIYHNITPQSLSDCELWLSMRQSGASMKPADKLTGPMRLIKTQQEINHIQKACTLSAQAHLHISENINKFQFEYQIESAFEHLLKTQGIKHMAYPSIVANASNACILHYQHNNSKLENNSLLLMDAGCEYQHWASDITRTWAIGTPTPEQLAIHQLVHETQTKVLKQIEIGQTIVHLQRIAIEHITQGLIKLGLLQGLSASLIKQKAYLPFYMHGIGHHLGLDVHDPCPYRQNNQPIQIQPGMCFTVEPGIYTPANGVPKAFRNIGVRIEDVIVVEKDGPKNLTAALKKSLI